MVDLIREQTHTCYNGDRQHLNRWALGVGFVRHVSCAHRGGRGFVHLPRLLRLSMSRLDSCKPSRWLAVRRAFDTSPKKSLPRTTSRRFANRSNFSCASVRLGKLFAFASEIVIIRRRVGSSGRVWSSSRSRVKIPKIACDGCLRFGARRRPGRTYARRGRLVGYPPLYLRRDLTELVRGLGGLVLFAMIFAIISPGK